jgi:hypothetical protein
MKLKNLLCFAAECRHPQGLWRGYSAGCQRGFRLKRELKLADMEEKIG